jgi:MFS family permease
LHGRSTVRDDAAVETPPPGAIGRRPSVRRQIAPLLAGYWAFGQFWGVWVILVFEYQRDHAISDSRIGVLYTALSIVAVGVMLVGAPRMSRLRLGTSVPIALASLGFASVAIALFPDSLVLLAFVLVGGGNGLIDIYVNVAAQRVESTSRRPVLQWLHASYALGGVTGAAVAGLLRTIDVDYRVGLLFAGAALLITALANVRHGSAERGAPGTGMTLSVAAFRRHPALWVPAAAVLFTFLVEGSMDTWSGLYLREQLGASAAVAAGAFMAFSAALFMGRLFAGRILFGLGPRVTILIAGFGSAIGGGIATLSGEPAVVAVAFLLMGFTISAAAPAGFSLVEDTGADPTAGIAAISTVGYTGFVWSPPLLGYVADTISLRAAMAVIVLATGGIVVSGLFARRRVPAAR